MFFITLEGIDGCGKSTCSNYLKEILEEKGLKSIVSREPGGEFISEKIRELILDNKNDNMNYWTEALLYIASRSQHQSKIIKPSIEKGVIVICERYSDSTLVYQGYARGLGIDNIKKIQDIVLGDLIPDLSLYLHITPEESLKRLNKRISEKKIKKDRLENEGDLFFKKVYNGYQKIYEDDKGNRIKKIDASQSIENVKNQIKNILNNFLKNKDILNVKN